MEKRFGKRKIIILTIAILVAILSLSIAIFGIIVSNKGNNSSIGLTEDITIGSQSYKRVKSSSGIVYKNTKGAEVLNYNYDKGVYVGDALALKIYAYELNNGVIPGSADVWIWGNIDFSEDHSGIEMVPIGTKAISFSGCFYGQGYKISNLPVCYLVSKEFNVYATGVDQDVMTNNFGMFYNLAGEIQNVHFESINWKIDLINDTEYYCGTNGSLHCTGSSTEPTHGYGHGLNCGLLISKLSSEATIKNCLFTDCSITLNASRDYQRCGSIVGFIDEEGALNVENSAINCNIKATTLQKRSYMNKTDEDNFNKMKQDSMGLAIGGVAGDIGFCSSINMVDSYYNGDMDIETYNWVVVGGISGRLLLPAYKEQGFKIEIKNSYIQFSYLSIECIENTPGVDIGMCSVCVLVHKEDKIDNFYDNNLDDNNLYYYTLQALEDLKIEIEDSSGTTKKELQTQGVTREDIFKGK